MLLSNYAIDRIAEQHGHRILRTPYLLSYNLLSWLGEWLRIMWRVIVISR